jgi:hypothetical protein
MVLNVAKESPADKAGLVRFDVIVKCGQEDVTSVEQFIQRVRTSESGARVVLHIVHEGKDKDVDVTLAAPPAEQLEYKYAPFANGLLDDRFDVRGKVFRKTPGGWRMEDFGELQDLPQWFEEGGPRFRHRHGEFWTDGERAPDAKFKAHVTRDGKVIDIEGQRDGSVTVRRSPGKSGAADTATFKGLDDLRKGDPEAYDVYREATGRRSHADHPVAPGTKAPSSGSVERYRDWMKDLAERLPAVDRQRLNELLEDMKKEVGPGVESARKHLGELEKRIEEWYRSQGGSEPATRFEATSDGKITVHLREGENALTLHFDNLDQLKAKRPDLYQKYEAMEKKR